METEYDEKWTHPLLQPPILERIFHFLPVSALKECRMVSRLWRNETFEEIQHEAWISLKSSETTVRQTIEKFVVFAHENYEEPDDIIVRNFRLEHFNVTTTEGHDKTRLPEFMSIFGPCISTLELKRCTMSKELFRKVVSSDWTPNLKNLMLETCSFIESATPVNQSSNNIRKLTFNSDQTEFAHPFRIIYLWNLFPKLTDLCITDISEEDSTSVLEAAVEWKREHKKPLPVTKLKIFGEAEFSVRKIPNHSFELLFRAGLPLTRLELDIEESVEEAQLEKLMKTFSRTLETLVIWRGLLASRLRGFPFSVFLPKLRTLGIPDNCVEDLKFVNYMGGLRKLSIVQCGLESIPYETHLFNDLELDPHLGLRYISIEYNVAEPEINFLRYVFPKLIQLSAFIDREFVALIL